MVLACLEIFKTRDQIPRPNNSDLNGKVFALMWPQLSQFVTRLPCRAYLEGFHDVNSGNVIQNKKILRHHLEPYYNNYDKTRLHKIKQESMNKPLNQTSTKDLFGVRVYFHRRILFTTLNQ